MAKKTSDYAKYVVTSDIARRLRACGVSMPSLFFWVCNEQLKTCVLHHTSDEYFGALEDKLPAYTAFEIKELFPVEVWVSVQRSLKRCRGLFHFTKYNGLYAVSLMVRGDGTDKLYEFRREEDVTEASACGRMLLYILENGMKPTL